MRPKVMQASLEFDAHDGRFWWRTRTGYPPLPGGLRTFKSKVQRLVSKVDPRPSAQ